jgi:succinate dehydrogenase/fumarate reductase flavoprotein subunit
MRDDVGIVRDENRLSHALTEIDHLEEELERDVSISPIRRYNTELLDALELKNMLTCARMIATSARLRKESRGAHLRLDYPVKDDRSWIKNISLWKGKEQIETLVTDVAAPDIDGDGRKGPGS